jgi:hypothetical protein
MLSSVTTQDAFTLFVMFAIVAALAIGGFLVAQLVKKWSRREEQAQNFTLQDLRELRARGQISDAEFTAMRAAILGKMGERALPAGPQRDEAPPASEEGRADTP